MLSRTSCSLSPVTAHTFKEGMATEFSGRFCSGAEGIVESSESRQLSCRSCGAVPGWDRAKLRETAAAAGGATVTKASMGVKKRALNQEWKGWGEEQKGRKKNHPEMSCLLHPCGKYSS